MKQITLYLCLILLCSVMLVHAQTGNKFTRFTITNVQLSLENILFPAEEQQTWEHAHFGKTTLIN